jgi:predicted ATPase
MSFLESDKGETLFGREREIENLQKIWENQKGGVILIDGEAGVGKSSLAKSFCRQLQALGFRIQPLICSPHHTATPLHPLVQLIRDITFVQESWPSSDLYSHLHSYVGSLLPSDPDHAVSILSQLFPIPSSIDSRRSTCDNRTFSDKMLALFRNILLVMSREGPIIIVVEDLHWADEATSEILGKILEEPEIKSSISFLMTARPDALPEWLRSCRSYGRISLGPLGEAPSRNFVAFLDEASVLPEEILAHISTISGGIPLFIKDMTRQFLKDLPPENRKWAPHAIKIPTTILDILGSRLDCVTSILCFLQKAAIIGRIIPESLLKAFCQDDFPWIDEALCRAEKAGILEEDASRENTFRFCHPLMQEAVLQSIVRKDRIRLHREAIRILTDELPEEANCFPEGLALHWAGAEEWTKAIEDFERAADTALQQRNTKQAGKYFLNASRLLPHITDMDLQKKLRDRLSLMLTVKLPPL